MVALGRLLEGDRLRLRRDPRRSDAAFALQGIDAIGAQPMAP